MNRENGFDVKLIAEQLLGADFGTVVTFSELSALTGKDIQFKDNHILRQALALLLEGHNLVFENVRNIGYTKLRDTEVVQIHSLKHFKRTRNAARKGVRVLETVSYDDLEPHVQIQQQSRKAALLFAKIFATEKSCRQIAENTKKIQMRIEDMRASIEHFLNEKD